MLRHVGDQVVAREAALHQAQLSRLQQLCAEVDASIAALMKAFAEVQSRNLRQLSRKHAAEERKLQRAHDERAVVYVLRCANPSWLHFGVGALTSLASLGYLALTSR
jgi:ribosomal 50S subunit-associated protein YjgA (DUF615 family)